MSHSLAHFINYLVNEYLRTAQNRFSLHNQKAAPLQATNYCIQCTVSTPCSFYYYKSGFHLFFILIKFHYLSWTASPKKKNPVGWKILGLHLNLVSTVVELSFHFFSLPGLNQGGKKRKKSSKQGWIGKEWWRASVTPQPQAGHTSTLCLKSLLQFLCLLGGMHETPPPSSICSSHSSSLKWILGWLFFNTTLQQHNFSK